jgi:hypothetical protein
MNRLDEHIHVGRMLVARIERVYRSSDDWAGELIGLTEECKEYLNVTNAVLSDASSGLIESGNSGFSTGRFRQLLEVVTRIGRNLNGP